MFAASKRQPDTGDPFRQKISDTDRTIDSVRESASNLLSVFKSKLDEISGDDALTKNILRQGFDGSVCFEEAIKFFGSDAVPYIAIDGTQVEEARLDMIVFYAGAFGYRGEIKFFENGDIVAGDAAIGENYASLSCAIPLSEEYASLVAGELTGWGTEVDTERIPQSLMRLSEYLLAYKSIVRDSSRIVLMDRTISGDIAHISWKMREYLKDPIRRCILEGRRTSFGEITKTDLELGRMLISNKNLKIPSPRSQFAPFAIMALLSETNCPLTTSEICDRLGIAAERRGAVVEKVAKKFADVVEYDRESSTLSLKRPIANYLDKLLEASMDIAARICGDAVRNESSSHPLRIEDPHSGKMRWLNCDDIEYLTLVLITAILKECWERNVLLLGIAKDSAANELSKTVIPLLQEAQLLDGKFTMPAFESDKMLLQANSLVNSEIVGCPWRTIEYDACFRTVVSSENKSKIPGACNALGAFQNVVAGERTFVKAYFQLWSSAADPNVRSHVFIYDRPCYHQYDACSPELVLLNRDNNIEEKIFPAIHFQKNSPLSELVLGILYSMGTEAIPEALGHNYPLFLADKRAKVAENQAHSTYVSAVELELNRARLDQQLLFQGPFRGYRSVVETGRRKKAKRPTT